VEIGDIKTNIGEEFEISITEESDLSMDGGHTFEEVTNVAYLNIEQARQLIRELSTFCKQ
jgi:hypothetical protein